MNTFKKLTILILITTSLPMLGADQAAATKTPKRKVVRAGTLIGDALPYCIYRSIAIAGVPVTGTLALGSVGAIGLVFVLRSNRIIGVAGALAVSATSLGLTYLSAKITWYCERKAHQIMANLTEEESAE